MVRVRGERLVPCLPGVFAGFVANLLHLCEAASSAPVPRAEFGYAHELGYGAEDAEGGPLIRRASGLEAATPTPTSAQGRRFGVVNAHGDVVLAANLGASSGQRIFDDDLREASDIADTELRERVLAELDSSFDAEVAGLLKALALGKTESLTDLLNLPDAFYGGSSSRTTSAASLVGYAGEYLTSDDDDTAEAAQGLNAAEASSSGIRRRRRTGTPRPTPRRTPTPRPTPVPTGPEGPCGPSKSMCIKEGETPVPKQDSFDDKGFVGKFYREVLKCAQFLKKDECETDKFCAWQGYREHAKDFGKGPHCVISSAKFPELQSSLITDLMGHYETLPAELQSLCGWYAEYSWADKYNLVKAFKDFPICPKKPACGGIDGCEEVTSSDSKSAGVWECNSDGAGNALFPTCAPKKDVLTKIGADYLWSKQSLNRLWEKKTYVNVTEWSKKYLPKSKNGTCELTDVNACEALKFKEGCPLKVAALCKQAKNMKSEATCNMETNCIWEKYKDDVCTKESGACKCPGPVEKERCSATDKIKLLELPKGFKDFQIMMQACAKEPKCTSAGKRTVATTTAPAKNGGPRSSECWTVVGISAISVLLHLSLAV